VKRERRKTSNQRGRTGASLKEIEKLLQRSAKLMNRAAGLIRDAALDPKNNIRRIGDALALVFEIEKQIYTKWPDLMPEFLKKRPT
jgi:hypothetical protein